MRLKKVTYADICGIIYPHAKQPEVKIALLAALRGMGIAALWLAPEYRYNEIYTRFRKVLRRFGK
jgi:hypothetical protein